MSDYPDVPVPDVSAAAVPPPDTNMPEIRAQAADAIIGPIPVKKAKEDSARRASRAGLPYFNPHSFRNTLVQLAYELKLNGIQGMVAKIWARNIA
jgi:hypothetical protein